MNLEIKNSRLISGRDFIARTSAAVGEAESFKNLHMSAGDDYALGWVVFQRPWAKGRALMHNGSNTMFYVVVWLAPELNSAVIVATNMGGDEATAGCDETAVKLTEKYFEN